MKMLPYKHLPLKVKAIRVADVLDVLHGRRKEPLPEELQVFKRNDSWVWSGRQIFIPLDRQTHAEIVATSGDVFVIDAHGKLSCYTLEDFDNNFKAILEEEPNGGEDVKNPQGL